MVVVVFVRNGVEEESALPIWCALRRHSKRLSVDETIEFQGIRMLADKQNAAVEESVRWL